MKRIISVGGLCVAALGLSIVGIGSLGSPGVATAQARQVPKFQVDPAWPKIPPKWKLGQVSSVAVDDQDHVWIIQRPRSLKPQHQAMAAPPVIEFDAAGNFVQGWGGPGEGYEWPQTEHGIFVDYKGYVWIGGSSRGVPGKPDDDQLIKFTRAGKFVMQIGHAGQSKGNKDTVNLRSPADTWVYPKTNELFVADGYVNKRVIVFDADTGAFKRMWGAFGNEPVDNPEPPARPGSAGRGGGGGGRGRAAAAPAEVEGPEGLPQFNTVHAARVSNDGLVYVSDRGGKRVQVFTIEGKFVNQVFIDRWCEVPHCGSNGHTAASTAFSADPQQRFLYIASRSPARVWVLDRKTLEILDSFGRPGVAPGEFYVLHHMGVDSKGNLFVTEVEDGMRIQKFAFKGLSPAPAKTLSSTAGK